MFDFNSILSNAAEYSKAKTATTAEVDNKYNELLGIQESRNKQYDKMLTALQQGTDALSAEDAKDLLAENGFVKVDMNKAYKANLKNQVKEAMDAEKNAQFKANLAEMKELYKEFAEIDQQQQPKSSIEKYIELKIAQEFPTAPAYQPPYQQQINAQLAKSNEKARLNREMDSEIEKVKQLQKDRIYGPMEATRIIGEIRGEYKKRIANL